MLVYVVIGCDTYALLVSILVTLALMFRVMLAAVWFLLRTPRDP